MFLATLAALPVADLVPYPGYRKPHHVFARELTGSAFLAAYSGIIILNFAVNAGILAGAYAVLLDHDQKKPGQVWFHAAWVTLAGWLVDGFGLALYRSRLRFIYPTFHLGLPDLFSYGVLMAVLLLVFNYTLSRWVYRLPRGPSLRIALALALLTNPFYVVGGLRSFSLTSQLWG